MLSNSTGLMTSRKQTLVLCLFLVGITVISSCIQFPAILTYEGQNLPKDNRLEGAVLSSTTMTRRQAIIDYVAALQAPEGYFHAYLRAPPPFDLDGTPPTYSSAEDAYYTLKYIGALDSINWTATVGFLRTLINQDTGLLNASKRSSPELYSCNDALIFFQDIGANEGINIEANIDFIARLQQPDGGFASNPYDPQTNIVQTYFAINGLRAVHALYKIDASNVQGFVLKCYHEDGGFGNTASAESDITTLPAGLCLVDMLGLWGSIDVNKTLSYILQFWNNDKGCDTSEDLLYTYYLAWSLAIIGHRDAMNTENLIQWLLERQLSLHGEFVGYPDAGPDNERLVFAFYATKLLSLYNATDRLDGNITVESPPHWEIPQWWLDYVRKNFGTTTTTYNRPNNFALPDLRFLLDALPYVGIMLLALTPAFAVVYLARSRRVKRRELRKQRKNMGRG